MKFTLTPITQIRLIPMMTPMTIDLIRWLSQQEIWHDYPAYRQWICIKTTDADRVGAWLRERGEEIVNDLTDKEAQKAYDEAIPVPLSKERIDEIVRYATTH